MKSLLIKIGKALSVLRRDGLIKGTVRNLVALKSLFHRVRSGEILIITGGAGVGDSARYRAHHVAEELNLQGLRTSVTIQDNPFLATYADKFKIFVFHRVLYTDKVKKLIGEIKKQKKEMIFETDDLVYDPQYLKHMDYYKVMNSLIKKLYENGVGGEILTDSYTKVCTTTTTFLANKLREKDKKVFIVRNKLSQQDIKFIEKIQVNRQDDKIKVGYFSGTPSHNKDFATINDALMAILDKYSQVELVLVGPLDIEDKLNKFQDKIVQLTFAAREKHFNNVANVDINVSPLEIGNPFCESKSELKFFEAGAVKVPTVASATQTFKEAINDGVDGFVAATTEEWIEKLSRLIENENLRKSMGQKAYEKVRAKYVTTVRDNEEYYKYLRNIIEREK